MSVHTRFFHLSDIEFERELGHRVRSGQLVLGSEITRELMERIRRWVNVAGTGNRVAPYVIRR